MANMLITKHENVFAGSITQGISQMGHKLVVVKDNVEDCLQNAYVYAFFYGLIPNSSKYNTLVIKKRGSARWWGKDITKLPAVLLSKEVQIIDFPGICVLLGGKAMDKEEPEKTIERCLMEQIGVVLPRQARAQKKRYLLTDVYNNTYTCLRFEMSNGATGLNILADAINSNIRLSMLKLRNSTINKPLPALYARDEIDFAYVKELGDSYDDFYPNTMAMDYRRTFPDNSPFEVKRLINDNTFFVNTIFDSIPYNVCACVYYQDENKEIYVLVAQKRSCSRWVNKDVSKKYAIVNNPGQWVLPGGKSNVGESATEAAIREFKEETGAMLEPAQVFSEDYHYSTDTNNHKRFCGVFFNMGNKDNFDALLTTINSNLKANTTNSMNTNDDELFRVSSGKISAAINFFAKLPNPSVECSDKTLPKYGSVNTDISWFKEVLERLKQRLDYVSSTNEIAFQYAPPF